MTIKNIRHDLVYYIMHTTDLEKLKSMHALFKSSAQVENTEDVLNGNPVKPPTVEIAYNVSLADIKSNQIVEPISYDEIAQRVGAEVYAKPLAELLDTLD